MKPLTRFALAALLTAVTPLAAHAGAFHFRAASGDIPSGSNCTRISNAIPANAPYTAMRCTNVGSSPNTFVLNYVYPTDATVVGLFPHIHISNPDSGVSGNYCFNVCMGVILSGQSRNAADLSACSTVDASPVSTAITTQNVVKSSADLLTWGGADFLGIQPKATDGSVCNATSCAGAELIVLVKRINTIAGCTATNNVDYHGISVTYN